ncbi:MAG TPA: transcription factor E [Methanothermococcus okinawensis]|uniref:Transcription factor E n=1 Tax=Methanothermococcus okinawensis TaxID=155863 RepID=A0A832ZIP1_9EURY|nr:transcription factor E [Methanococcaceae archaeon]HIP84799.1 transcription factor E [Methanothermococcus okinawensis]HIP90928.1 transcription factor E [Methanothermococcus okinawensis]
MVSKKKLYEILENPLAQQIILDILEDNIEGLDVLSTLMELGEATDDEIARQLNMKLNTVRKILYKLYDARLVDYTREKEEDINWYTYTWKPTLDKLPWIVKKRGQELLKKLREQLAVEENSMFFYCPRCEIKYIFEEAMDCGFRCPHCGGALKEYDNSRDIELLKNQIKFIEEELKSSIFHIPTTSVTSKGRRRSRRRVKGVKT